VNSPVWTPDGLALVGRKHFRNTRSLGAGEMWIYHIGGGDGLQLTARRNWEQNAGEPELSRDGRYLYYSEDISPGGGFQYNRDPYGVIYASSASTARRATRTSSCAARAARSVPTSRRTDGRWPSCGGRG
jgi:hypothetical protein